MKITRFQDVPQFTRGASYAVDVSWDLLEEHLRTWTHPKSQEIAALDLDPDFQRGHVWTREKQIAYVEFILRGGTSSRDLLVNCTGWMRTWKGPFVLVDGKQRLTAALAFLHDEIPVFGSVRSEYTDDMRWHACSFRVHVNNLATRAEVLRWYLDLNSGGVVHTQEELARVQALLEQEKS